MTTDRVIFFGIDVGPRLSMSSEMAERNPHLAEAVRQIDVMQVNAVLWHLIRWNRARRVWKREMAAHKASRDGLGGERKGEI